MWPDGCIIFRSMAVYIIENWPSRKKIAKVGTKVCQMPNQNNTKNVPKTVKILPIWQFFAKSGHTAFSRMIEGREWEMEGMTKPFPSPVQKSFFLFFDITFLFRFSIFLRLHLSMYHSLPQLFRLTSNNWFDNTDNINNNTTITQQSSIYTIYTKRQIISSLKH